MTTLHGETDITSEALLKAVAQLNGADLERFVADVIALRARRTSDCLPKEETELLSLINEGIPADIREPYAELKEKRRREILTPDEHKELLHFTALVERLQMRRVENLIELARIRETTLAALMKDLGIRIPEHA
jgi:hypothetical protein